MERLSKNNSEIIKNVLFDTKDIERHPAVAEVLRLYAT